MDIPSLVKAMKTDAYQLTMAYAYWKNGNADDPATFEYFFRKCPFGGEFALFGGLGDLIRFLQEVHFTEEDITYLQETLLVDVDPGFFDWLRAVDFHRLTVSAVPEGTAVFARVPLVQVSGPLAIAQLLESPLLQCLNFPTLMVTNAVRYRLAAGPDKKLFEFGFRRAQDPMRASEYALVGGFTGTSNVEASRLFGVMPVGTMAHSFVQTFKSVDDVRNLMLKDTSGADRNFLERVLAIRVEHYLQHTNDGELAAFVAYAQAFPKKFLALVDTYDTLRSGVPNFLCVAKALVEWGYQPVGIRIDSGDLAHLSQQSRRQFNTFYAWQSSTRRFIIVVSNDIDEATLWSLRQQEQQIDTMGIGTHLVTCAEQPALGGVYKLVFRYSPCLKLSGDPGKTTLPGRKISYRLIGEDGKAILDLLMLDDELAPLPGIRVLCRHPVIESSRVYVVPSEVVPLHEVVWGPGIDYAPRGLEERRARVKQQLALLREDHLRHLNPTPYKVSVSDKLYHLLHGMIESESQIPEIR